MTGGGPLELEATGETVGEAKWAALRELERRYPGIDKTAVEFEVLSEGERGLLGVGYAPARVVASVSAPPPAEDPPGGRSPPAAEAGEVVERIVAALEVPCRVDVHESDDEILVTCTGADLGVVIGRHGQTIDAIQYLVAAILARSQEGTRRAVVVDAAGYRARRRATLEALADRAAERVRREGEPVALEPMTSAERRIVHVRLQEAEGVETSSEGNEPARFVVVAPAGAPAGAGPEEAPPPDAA